MRKLNIVLFSSGVSEKNGILDKTIKGLESKGYNVFCWRDLFANAHKADHIALLPILIKKIPTFDFAVLIGEGHDATKIFRDGKYISVSAMRDNVLFEIGLCVMALGLSRVIFLSDNEVRLPDDLTGINGELAIKHIVWSSDNKTIEYIDNHIQEHKDDYFIGSDIFDDINCYVEENRKYVSPVVIGAATSTAIGYATNFIIRLLECIESGFISDGKFISFPLQNVYMHVVIPEDYNFNIKKSAMEKMNDLKKGIIKNARHRELSFNYRIENGNLHIYDYPTSLVTSYDTAKMILNIDADESEDVRAKERFYEKELDLFEATLINILNRSFVNDSVEEFYENLSLEEKNKMVNNICYVLENNFVIERNNY